MKKIHFLTIILICFAQLLSAQQKGKEVIIPSSLEITKNKWIKTHEKYGTIHLEFKKDSTYTVICLLKPDKPISGTFSLRGNLLIFETDSSCKMKAEYIIAITKESLNFTMKEDQCNGRNEIIPGIWKTIKTLKH